MFMLYLHSKPGWTKSRAPSMNPTFLKAGKAFITKQQDNQNIDTNNTAFIPELSHLQDVPLFFLFYEPFFDMDCIPGKFP